MSAAHIAPAGSSVTTAQRLALMRVQQAGVQTSAQAAAPCPGGHLRITGQLVRDAECRATSGAQPDALLLMEISTGVGATFSAQQDLGTGFSAHLAAHTKARFLRRGATVTVTCAGAQPRADQAGAHMVCLRVQDATPHQLPAHLRAGAPD